MSEEARAYTASEARESFLDCVRGLVSYWNRQPAEDRASGVAFSILTLLDGSSSFPAVDLVLRPAFGDKEFDEIEGSNWYEDGQIINGDCMLHERFYRPPNK